MRVTGAGLIVQRLQHSRHDVRAVSDRLPLVLKQNKEELKRNYDTDILCLQVQQSTPLTRHTVVFWKNKNCDT